MVIFVQEVLYLVVVHPQMQKKHRLFQVFLATELTTKIIVLDQEHQTFLEVNLGVVSVQNILTLANSVWTKLTFLQNIDWSGWVVNLLDLTGWKLFLLNLEIFRKEFLKQGVDGAKMSNQINETFWFPFTELTLKASLLHIFH